MLGPEVYLQQRVVTSDMKISQQLQPCKQLRVACEGLALMQSGWLCQQHGICTRKIAADKAAASTAPQQSAAAVCTPKW